MENARVMAVLVAETSA
jgi:hypothetical protein